MGASERCKIGSRDRRWRRRRLLSSEREVHRQVSVTASSNRIVEFDQSPNGILRFLQTKRESMPRPPAGALLSIAAIRAKGREVLLGRALFSDRPIAPRDNRSYPFVEMFEDWFDSESFDAWARDALHGTARLGERVVATDNRGARAEQQVPVIRSYSGWSELVVQLSLQAGSGETIPHGPVVHPRLPPFSSAQDAATRWAFPESHWMFGSGFPYAGCLLAVLPDTRGRIVSANWDLDRVAVEIEANDPLSSMSLQAVFEGADDEQYQFAEEPAEIHSIEIPAGAQGASLYLVHETNDLLSQFYVSQAAPYAGPAEAANDDTEDVLAELSGGENDLIEFKPFLIPGHQKRNEVVKSAIAFANSRGGTIYIGVTDEGNPEGRAALHKAFKSNPDEALDAACRDYRKLVIERVKPVPRIEVSHVAVHGEPVVRIKVLPGPAVPYSTHENEFYVRKGASNRRPDPQSELPALLQRLAGPSLPQS